MLPTLKNGNLAIIKKYNLKINHNDIVVIKKKDKIIIKRIIGLPNDEIELNQYLYVNGEKIDELPKDENKILNGNFLLKENEYFVLGDNRKKSTDSRYEEIGIIKRNEIIGKVIIK